MMMEVENLVSDLQALKQLYGLLRSSSPQHFLLGEKARVLLKRLLDCATEQAFQRHAKIIAAQSAISTVNCTKPSLQDHPQQPIINNNNPSNIKDSHDEDLKQKSNTTTISTTAAILGNSDSMNSRCKKRCKICGKSTMKRLNSTKEDNTSSSINQNNYNNNNNKSGFVVNGKDEGVRQMQSTKQTTDAYEPSDNKVMDRTAVMGPIKEMPSQVPTQKPPTPSNKTDESTQSQQHEFTAKRNPFNFGQKDNAGTPTQAPSLTFSNRVEPTGELPSRLASLKVSDRKSRNSVGPSHEKMEFVGLRTQIMRGRKASYVQKKTPKPKPKPTACNNVGGPTFASPSETDHQPRQMVVLPTLLDQPPRGAMTMGPAHQNNHKQQRLQVMGPPRLKDLPRQQESYSSTSTSETVSPSWTSEEYTSSDSEVNSLPRRMPTQHRVGPTSERVLSNVSQRQGKLLQQDREKRRGRGTTDDSDQVATRSRYRGGSAEIGRLRRIKDKLGLIFHHHHHHHHHHHSESEDNDHHHQISRVERSNQGRSMWGFMRKMIHRGNTEENPVEGATRGRRIRPQQQQQGHLHALVDGLLRHVWNSNKSKPSPRDIGRLGRNKKKKVVKKWHWWQRLYKSGRRGSKVGSSGRVGFKAKRHRLPAPTKRR